MRSRRLLSFWLLAFLGAGLGEAGAEPPGAPAVFVRRAEQKYEAARTRYDNHITSAEAAWQFGRACFDRADVEADKKQKEGFAEQGCYACRQALIDDPRSAWGHYYLGLNTGELASAKGLGALHLLHDMEDEWKAAIRLDEKIDYGGPNRSLGMLYRDAPGWPLSIGNRNRAIRYLTEAERLSPDYPDNALTLAEAYLKWNDYRQAGRMAERIPEALAQARKKLTGPDWESSWVDWTRRWLAIQARLSETNRPQSPHVEK
jgi:tetratricopeptide (TPR) repeat protein